MLLYCMKQMNDIIYKNKVGTRKILINIEIAVIHNLNVIFHQKKQFYR